MRYLVTGGTGFLGGYIVKELDKNGSDIYITTRIPKAPNQIKADFENSILSLSDISFDCVIHAAGKAHMVPKTEKEKESFFRTNVDGTKLLLDEIDKLNTLPKSFVFISSVAVYGLESGTDITEEYALDATSPYGKSKIEAELLIQEWGQKNNVIIGIVRLPLIAGKDAPGNLQSMIIGIKKGLYFRIGKGDARKSMVWAGDVAAILPVLAQKGGIYNLTDGIHPTFSELENGITAALNLKHVKKMPLFFAKLAGLSGTIIEKITGKKMPISSDMVQKITSPLTFSDAKAREELGWNPTSVLGHIKEMI